VKLRIQRYECEDRVWFKVERKGWFGRWSSIYCDVHRGTAVTFTSDVTYDTFEQAEAALAKYIRSNEPVVSTTVKEVET
jgi:hypothetical protein